MSGLRVSGCKMQPLRFKTKGKVLRLGLGICVHGSGILAGVAGIDITTALMAPFQSAKDPECYYLVGVAIRDLNLL